jgi:hypothetical protein
MSGTERRGVYGFALTGLSGVTELLHPAHDDWPTLEIGSEDGGSVDQAEAELDLPGGGVLRMQRDPLRAGFSFGGLADDRALVHPYLVPAAAIAGRWHGRQAFHAGGFVAGQGVWGVVGDRNSGKSTLLAGLHATGRLVVADDLLMVSKGIVYPGPRAIDLREEAARELGLGESIGVVGARERWRLALPDDVPPLPLIGWIFLEWGTSVEFAAMRPADRVARLLRQRTLQEPGGDPALLDIVAKPAVVFRRPRYLSSVMHDAQLLVGALA